ncbi:MAG: hypothetical protein JWR10_4019 [Rubritepida sp.]|nr:hypothetical protein [Rubritepida sp.]
MALWPVLDSLRATVSSDGEGLLVEVATLEGEVLRFGLHRLALGAVVSCLLDAARHAPPTGATAPAARVAADAAGVTLSETGETLLVLETGGTALAYALPPTLLHELAGSLIGLQPAQKPPTSRNRRHDA